MVKRPLVVIVDDSLTDTHSCRTRFRIGSLHDVCNEVDPPLEPRDHVVAAAAERTGRVIRRLLNAASVKPFHFESCFATPLNPQLDESHSNSWDRDLEIFRPPVLEEARFRRIF